MQVRHSAVPAKSLLQRVSDTLGYYHSGIRVGVPTAHIVAESGMTKVSSKSASREQDCKLVARALEGDQSAYTALMQKYTKALRRYLLRRVHRPGEVDDLVQESFIKAFKALKTYSSSYAFSTWLYKIATNHAIDFHRRRRLDTVSLNKPVRQAEGETLMDFPSEDSRPDHLIVRKQRRLLIRDAIDQLPPKYHRVIVLRHQKDMSYQEIAQELDLPLGTVKAHIFRARRKLYGILRDKRDVL